MGNNRENVTFWAVSTGKELYTVKGKSPIAFSANSKILATAIKEGDTITFWDTATGKEIQQLKGHSKGVDSMAFSRDGKVLATTDGSDTIVLWDVKTGKERRLLTEH